MHEIISTIKAVLCDINMSTRLANQSRMFLFYGHTFTFSWNCTCFHFIRILLWAIWNYWSKMQENVLLYAGWNFLYSEIIFTRQQWIQLYFSHLTIKWVYYKYNKCTFILIIKKSELRELFHFYTDCCFYY